MATYTLISSITVGATAVASVEFTSIPATYTDLVVLFSGRSNTVRASDGPYAQIQFNGSGVNLSSTFLYNFNAGLGNGSSGSNILGWSNPSDYSANSFSNSSWYISNYASSDFKSVSVDTLTGSNNAFILMGFTAGLFSSTSAITSIKIKSEASSLYVQNTTAYLYGISNA